MTTFEDGPAKGQCLMLTRAPHFLRVVQVQTTHWDALDQPDDHPRADEKVHVYVMEGTPGWCHINRRGGGGGRFTTARYKLYSIQPPDATLRNVLLWRAWCRAQVTPKVEDVGTVPDL